jgi:hybrid cluster-associated redox disulfide protein
MVVSDLTSDEILQTTVAEVLRLRPAAVQAFVALRMACVGCVFSAFDTLEEALEAHHIRPARMLAALDSIGRTQPLAGPGPSQSGGNL